MWQGLQTITGYKPKPPSPPIDDVTTPNSLNEFYARFDRQNNTTSIPISDFDQMLALPPPFTVQEFEVQILFRKQQVNKAAGPDGVTNATLKHCADQLAPVFTDIFNTSLSKKNCSILL